MCQFRVDHIGAVARIGGPTGAPGVGAAAGVTPTFPNVTVMRAIPSHPVPDVDDVLPRDDLVVVLLEVSIAVVFAGILGLALFWVG